MNRGAWWAAVHGAAKEWATELATEQQQKLTYGKKRQKYRHEVSFYYRKLGKYQENNLQKNRRKEIIKT